MPSMIGSFLQVALIDDDVVRETVIPIFFDMLQCEFHSSSSRVFSKVFCFFVLNFILLFLCISSCF